MIFYAYIGYPLSLYLVSLIKRNQTNHPEEAAHHTVSLLISAYNEEKVIDEKIKNSLSLSYPPSLLEIVVVSDGSTDRTEEIVKQYSDQGVILRSYQGRIGKTACLNEAVPLAKGEIVVFSDANSRYDKNAIKELVRHFGDDQIGFVTGKTEYVSGNGSNVFSPINFYSKLEIFVKNLESKISSCVGADGAIFAIRKKLFKALSDADINDLVIPLKIIKQGYKGILEEKAFCIENSANGYKDEFRRQERITNRTIRAIFNDSDMLNPFKFGLFSFELFSHKISKFLVPFFMITLLIANLFLITKGPFFLLFLTGQLAFYLLAVLGYFRKCWISLSKVISPCRTFLVVNLAILNGWVKYLKGDTYTTWTTLR